MEIYGNHGKHPPKFRNLYDFEMSTMSEPVFFLLHFCFDMAGAQGICLCSKSFWTKWTLRDGIDAFPRSVAGELHHVEPRGALALRQRRPRGLRAAATLAQRTRILPSPAEAAILSGTDKTVTVTTGDSTGDSGKSW